MRLFELLSALPRRTVRPSPAALPDLKITGIVCDSRQVQSGQLFVAIPGVQVDGHSFILDAVRRGAAAVIGQRPDLEVFPKGLPVPYVRVSDSREAWAWLSAAWYGHPARKLCVIGVTGTDGKTTTVRLIGEDSASGRLPSRMDQYGERIHRRRRDRHRSAYDDP